MLFGDGQLERIHKWKQEICFECSELTYCVEDGALNKWPNLTIIFWTMYIDCPMNMCRPHSHAYFHLFAIRMIVELLERRGGKFYPHFIIWSKLNQVFLQVNSAPVVSFENSSEIRQQNKLIMRQNELLMRLLAKVIGCPFEVPPILRILTQRCKKTFFCFLCSNLKNGIDCNSNCFSFLYSCYLSSLSLFISLCVFSRQLFNAFK